ncbi:MAG: short-chain dehydrogenase [Planctomycetaceae bacterium]|nr:short-chain dehydrogenase [Planctomycetaceae bacterium]
MKSLDGRVAVITGAGRGIGREHALYFAAQGARLVVNDPAREGDGSETGSIAQQLVDEINARGGQAVADVNPVGTSEAAERIVQTANETYGRIDILVNNAGILRDRTILNMTDEEWDDVIRVHLTGTFTCLRAAAKAMKSQGDGGRIINTSSSSGLLGNFGQANYGAAKAGVHALTRIASWELAKHGITVNAIAPLAATRMLESMPGTDVELLKDALDPKRIAPLVAFLASDAAAEISGVTFGVEGNSIFTYRMMTSHGETRYEQSEWTVDAIAASIQQIVGW